MTATTPTSTAAAVYFDVAASPTIAPAVAAQTILRAVVMYAAQNSAAGVKNAAGVSTGAIALRVTSTGANAAIAAPANPAALPASRRPTRPTSATVPSAQAKTTPRAVSSNEGGSRTSMYRERSVRSAPDRTGVFVTKAWIV